MNSTIIPIATAAAASTFRSSVLQPTIETRRKIITEEMFGVMLNKGYSVSVNGVLVSGENKHGHTLSLKDGFVCCEA